LLRPGRFDRQVMVGVPDVREREQIIKIHAKNKPISEDVVFSKLAQSTPGFTPADLENVMNEAALLSARKNDKVIRMESIKEAIIKVIAGVEKKSRIVSEKERKLTAYHEAGHAVLASVLPETDPVHQVTIIPRGRAGGFTMQLPEEDRSYATKKGMEKELIILLGGRVAESLVLGDISTGAQNDLGRVTKIARAMVTKYAMSDNLGSMSYDTEDEVFLGRDFTSMKNYSEHVGN
jgi:cell division protease FtsH